MVVVVVVVGIPIFRSPLLLLEVVRVQMSLVVFRCKLLVVRTARAVWGRVELVWVVVCLSRWYIGPVNST